MLYHNVQVMGHLLRLIDAVSVSVATAGALWYSTRDGFIPWQSLIPFCCALVVYFVIVAERLHVYFARRTEEIARELLALFEVLLYATGLACVTAEIIGQGLPGRNYLGALAAAAVALLGLRLAMRVTVRRLRRLGDDYRVWLIVGHNERAADLAETILANPQYGIRIAEVVDIADKNDKLLPQNPRFAAHPLSALKYRVLDDTSAIREIAVTRVIDEVVIALPVRSCYDKIREIVEICSEAGISVKFRPEVLELPGFRTQLSHVGAIPMVTHFSGPSNYRLLVAKRIVDVIGAAAGLLVLSHLVLVIGAAVKLTSPGSVLFFQWRVGLHGRHFRMIKFRSMVREAPMIRADLGSRNERDGTAFKIRNDARITPVGRVLRKYRLDELPQLWNVLVGDMSLVGPRPFPVSEAVGFEWWHRRRLTMPPGLTCLWQLADDPSMPMQQWMELDMDYIDRWSLWLDFKLIALTLATVVRGRGW